MRKWKLIAFLAVVAIGVVGLAVIKRRIDSAFKGERRDVVLECPVYDEAKLAEANFLVKTMVPTNATDIWLRLSYTRRGFMGSPGDYFDGFGAAAWLRCRVGKEGLQEFAKMNDYVFQSESIKKNFCTNGPDNVSFIDLTWRQHNPKDTPYPTNFLAYNFIWPDCGGYSFLYDVDNETLYGEYGSN